MKIRLYRSKKTQTMRKLPISSGNVLYAVLSDITKPLKLNLSVPNADSVSVSVGSVSVKGHRLGDRGVTKGGDQG